MGNLHPAIIRVTASWLLFILLLVGGPAASADCSPLQGTAIQALHDGQITEGQPVTVRGTVTAVFAGREQLGGFYLQQPGSPPSAIFVYAPRLGQQTPEPGSEVQLAAQFARFHGRPQLTRVQAIHKCGQPGLPAPYPLRWPTESQQLERLHDVKVRIEQPLYISGNEELANYGSLTLTAGGRPFRPGEPARRSAATPLLLDDGSYRAKPRPIPYLDHQGTRRSGGTVEGLTGILSHAFDAWRIHPTRQPLFADTNPRPAPPPPPGDYLRIASFNVENYFRTLGRRGAADHAALQRQRDKLRDALQELNADILVIIEVENLTTARDDLLARLNAGQPEAHHHYRAVAHPAPGTDATQVALFYRPARVRLLGEAADRDPVHHRPPLLGWFQPVATGEPFGVVAVHFKAKSGCPRSGDIDRGEGCWNQRRNAQAQRLAAWLAQTRRDAMPVLIAGDINAYSLESPLQHLEQLGKHDQVARFWPAEQNYSYVFHAEAGRLDYLLANKALAERAVRAGIWHINADEPSFLAYDGLAPASGPWRSSDHDPLWVDLTD